MLQRLRQARWGAGLTQAEVAKALGKSQAFISKCELGERRIDAIELSDFAQIYGEQLDGLLPPSTAPRLVPQSYRATRQVAERGKPRNQSARRRSTKGQPPS